MRFGDTGEQVRDRSWAGSGSACRRRIGKRWDFAGGNRRKEPGGRYGRLSMRSEPRWAYSGPSQRLVYIDVARPKKPEVSEDRRKRW